MPSRVCTPDARCSGWPSPPPGPWRFVTRAVTSLPHCGTDVAPEDLFGDWVDRKNPPPRSSRKMRSYVVPKPRASLRRADERKQLLQLLRRRAAAVLADLERLGVLHLLARLLAVRLDEPRAILLRHHRVAVLEALPDFPPAFLALRGTLGERPHPPFDAALEELRLEHVDRRQLLLQHVVDIHRDVGPERIGALEAVGIVEERGVLFQVRRVGAEERHRHHVRRVL